MLKFMNKAIGKLFQPPTHMNILLSLAVVVLLMKMEVEVALVDI
jgi:hypothetical protein